MVVSTEVCNFSDFKIYPGKGIKLMTRDCRLAILASRKCKKFYEHKVKG